MSSFSSLSPIDATATPAASSSSSRSARASGSRPRTPPNNTSHFCRHRKPSQPGSRPRHQERLLSATNPPGFSPRISAADRSGHASDPTKSKVRSFSGARMSRNEVSPSVRVRRPERTSSPFQAHQSEHAPAGCLVGLPPLVLAQVAPASFNEPPSLSSSLTSAPSFLAPPTPQSKSSPARARRSAFITPSPSISSFKSCIRTREGYQTQWEPQPPSPSPLSHAVRVSQRSSQRYVPCPWSLSCTVQTGSSVCLLRTLFVFNCANLIRPVWEGARPGSGPVRFGRGSVPRAS